MGRRGVSGARVHYRALGPLEATSEQVALHLGGPRQQIVLCLLLSSPGRVVSVDMLVDAIWGERPPATARSQVHICVSGLRRQLSPGATGPTIDTQAPGYTLRLGPDDTSDLVLFVELADAGQLGGADPATAAVTLRAALDLWRGEPFGGLGASSAPLRDAALALWEQRASVLSALVELEFVLGRFAEVINDLRREVDRDPLAERVRGQLMVALHGAGRQAEALREYRVTRELLVEELGLEPGEHLRSVEQRILSGGPVLVPERPAAETAGGPVAAAGAEAAPEPFPRRQSAPRAVPRLLPPAVADFTGRGPEITTLMEFLSARPDAAAVASTPVAVVVGSAGIGKSTLAVQAAWRLVPHFPDGQLYADLRGMQKQGRSAALEWFLRALGVPSNAVPEDVQERLALYRQLLADRRILIVLDDAYSEDQVMPLLPGTEGCAMVVTSRRRLAAVPGALIIHLDPFRPDESVLLLSRVVGAERVDRDPAGAAELVENCGNLPLAVRIAAARLAARPHWSPAAMADRLSEAGGSSLDELRYGRLAVRESVLLTYDILEPPVRRLFRLLGLLDTPDFGEWIAGPLLGEGAEHRHPEDMLALLVEMHLLEVSIVDGSPRYGMHDLVRAVARERAAAEDSTSARLAALDRALRTLLELLDVAHRATYGGEYLIIRGDTERHPAPRRTVAEVARGPAGWHAREARFVTAAVTQAATLQLATLAWELALRAVVGFEANLDLDAWRETHAVARASVETHGDRLGAAAIDYSLGSLAVLTNDLTTAETLLDAAEAAFGAIGNIEGIGLVLRNQAFLDLQRGDLDRVSERAERALSAFRATGDPVGEAYVMRVLASRDLELGDNAAAVARLEEAVLLCRRTGNRRMTAQVLHRLGEARLALGDVDRGADIFLRVLALVRETGDTVGEAYALLGSAAAARRRGEVAESREMLGRAEELAQLTGERRVHGLICVEGGRLLLADGQLPAAADALTVAVDEFHALPLPLSEAEALLTLGDVHRLDGDQTSARRCWDAGLTVLRSIPEASGARLRGEFTDRTRERDSPDEVVRGVSLPGRGDGGTDDGDHSGASADRQADPDDDSAHSLE